MFFPQDIAQDSPILSHRVAGPHGNDARYVDQVLHAVSWRQRSLSQQWPTTCQRPESETSSQVMAAIGD